MVLSKKNIYNTFLAAKYNELINSFIAIGSDICVILNDLHDIIYFIGFNVQGIPIQFPVVDNVHSFVKSSSSQISSYSSILNSFIKFK